MPFEFRPITEAELPAFMLADQRSFSHAPPKTSEPGPWTTGELDRAFGAFDGGALIGAGRNYSFELTVPGGAVIPAAAVSWISTLPTHRRRGVLTEMMNTLLRDARDRGEIVSILTAAEGTIYRRFGYGIATARVGVTIERAHGAFANDLGTMGSTRFVSLVEAAELFPPVYEVARRARAGMVSRPDYWWPEVLFQYARDTDEATFAVVHEDASGVVDGYAFYSVVGEWNGGLPDRTANVIDLQGTTTEGRAAMWRYLLSIDLIVRVKIWNVPIDDPLRWLLADPRRLRVDFINDGLYAYLLDVAAALRARTYEADGALVVSFHEPDGAADAVLLEVSGGSATCAATTRRPDLVMPIGSLGAIYLGGVAPSNLAAAGWIDECTSGALACADAMFVTPIAPATLSYF